MHLVVIARSLVNILSRPSKQETKLAVIQELKSILISDNETEKINIKYFQGMFRAEFFLTCRL